MNERANDRRLVDAALADLKEVAPGLDSDEPYAAEPWQSAQLAHEDLSRDDAELGANQHPIGRLFEATLKSGETGGHDLYWAPGRNNFVEELPELGAPIGE